MTYSQKLRARPSQSPIRACITCKHKLPASKFWLQSNGRPINVCKDCYRIRTNKWRKKNRNKTRSYTQKWYLKNPEHAHKHKLMYRYGINLVHFNAMLESQGGVCAICARPESRKQHLSVDHCHSTGLNRGLLCDACNRSLGGFDDSPEMLRRACAYLEKFI